MFGSRIGSLSSDAFCKGGGTPTFSQSQEQVLEQKLSKHWHGLSLLSRLRELSWNRTTILPPNWPYSIYRHVLMIPNLPASLGTQHSMLPILESTVSLPQHQCPCEFEGPSFSFSTCTAVADVDICSGVLFFCREAFSGASDAQCGYCFGSSSRGTHEGNDSSGIR